jgi:carbon monoxide dehydrogenase subunit G
MTVRVRRVLEFDVPPERVWEFISDPAKRAGAISVVDSYDSDGQSGVWHVQLPIPLIKSTVAVKTRDVDVDPPQYVKFVGRASALKVTGEHTIEPTESGCRLINEFVVDGQLPGVERFFERNLDDELTNLERALRADVAPGG